MAEPAKRSEARHWPARGRADSLKLFPTGFGRTGNLSQIVKSGLWYISRQTVWLEKERVAAQAGASIYMPQRNAAV